MSRLLYKPEKTRLDIVIPLFLTALCCMTFCMNVIDSNTFDFPDQILLCCLTIFVSNSYYAIATRAQFANFMTKSFCASIKKKESHSDKQKNKRLSLVDDRMTLEESEDIRSISTNYTVVSSIMNTIDFEKKTREIRLFISREEVWYILYPVSVGFLTCLFAFQFTTCRVRSCWHWGSSYCGRSRNGAVTPTGREVVCDTPCSSLWC